MQIENGKNSSTTTNESLSELIKEKKANIASIGLGYVGLPTAAIFANIGFNVTGVDINQKIIDSLNLGCLKTTETGLEELVSVARKNGCLKATTNISEALCDANVIIACVQTPVNKAGHANLSFLENVSKQIGKGLKKEVLVIVQSTVPPGTITNIVLPILEKESGLKCGSDFWLAYCPERMAPGNGLIDLMQNSRLIGGYDAQSTLLSEELFKHITKGKLLTTDIPSAETSKLAENAFRFVNIAFANELAILCNQIGADVKEVIKLANTHPRVNIHQPGAGAGGPCLSKDTNLLLNSSGSKKFKAGVLSASIRRNKDMAGYIVDLEEEALRLAGKELSNSKTVVFGTAYKGDVDDSRDSPSEGIIRELKARKSAIVIYDPVCNESFGEFKAKTLTEAVNGLDCIIIATDHKVFYNLDLSEICKMMKKKPIVIDTKRIIDPKQAERLGFQYVTLSSVKF